MPIKFKDTVEEFWDIETIKYCLAHNPQYTSDDFFIEMSHFLGVKNKIWGMPSGRWALQHFLENTKGNSGEIVLAGSFNCGEIGTAVQKAGFILETFDLMDPLGRIDWGNIVAGLKKSHHAIIVPHLFGVPTDFKPILEKCQHLGILIIEDCAHALGGTIQGRMVGTLGDAAIFSFNHDKPLSLGWGGALLVNNPNLVEQFTPTIINFLKQSEEFEHLKSFINIMAKRRRRIGKENIFCKILNRLQNDRFSLPKFGIGSLRASLGIWQLKRYKEISNIRNKNSSLIKDLAQNYQCWHVGLSVKPTWIKQKVLTDPPERSQVVSMKLRDLGFRVGNFNWPTLMRGNRKSSNPYARIAASHCLDIPIHQNMNSNELEQISETLNKKY